ncbi:MAG: hypothetical protein E6J13_03870 [Chloroflexi bacterium]|nr:MAG: hypothetical protein E6J13_03870 [Chloroflexota bacterium]
MGALIEIPLGLVWAGGGMGDSPGPRDPSFVSALQLVGLLVLIVATLIAITLLWRVGLALTRHREQVHSIDTARRLVVLSLTLIATGLVLDSVRGDGTFFGTLILGVFNGASLVAGAVLWIDPKAQP